MNDEIKDTANKIVELLSSGYGAESIFLCGSRAVGDYEPDSDWDMFVLTRLLSHGDNRDDLIARLGIPELPGHYLQPFFLPADQAWDFKLFGLKLRFSEIILDNNGQAARIMEDAMAFYDKGPSRWDDTYIRTRMDKSLGYVKKMERLLSQGKHGELFRRICFHYTENVIPWWFGLRTEWPLRPQQAFAYIQEQDPGFYSQLERVFSDSPNSEKVDAYRKLHEMMFRS